VRLGQVGRCVYGWVGVGMGRAISLVLYYCTRASAALPMSNAEAKEEMQSCPPAGVLEEVHADRHAQHRLLLEVGRVKPLKQEGHPNGAYTRFCHSARRCSSLAYAGALEGCAHTPHAHAHTCTVAAANTEEWQLSVPSCTMQTATSCHESPCRWPSRLN
jgi:hypothetical protein